MNYADTCMNLVTMKRKTKFYLFLIRKGAALYILTITRISIEMLGIIEN